jgi:hypothetical protein
MKQTINEYQFIEAFKHAGRESQFSRGALFSLFAHLEDYENQSGTELELDPIAICCEYVEHESACAALRDYDIDEDDEEEALRWLRNRTQVIEFEGGIVIQQF